MIRDADYLIELIMCSAHLLVTYIRVPQTEVELITAAPRMWLQAFLLFYYRSIPKNCVLRYLIQIFHSAKSVKSVINWTQRYTGYFIAKLGQSYHFQGSGQMSPTTFILAIHVWELKNMQCDSYSFMPHDSENRTEYDHNTGEDGWRKQ